MNAELIEKYSQPIEDAIDYIEEKRIRSPSRPWKPDQRSKWKLRYPKCPLCNEEYSKDNPMTKEHIHPTVLGGYERDENIIPLCEKCNFARNNVMMTVLGTSAIKNIRNRWPIIKPSIQRFIIWCHASIYGDEDALNQYSDLNLEFSRERKTTFSFSSNEFQPPTSPKEKLSLWKRAETVGRNAMKSASESIKSLKPATKNHQEVIGLPERIVLHCLGQGCEQQLRIPSDHTGNFRCPKCKHEHLGTDSSPGSSKTSIKEKLKSKSSQKTENTLPIEEFQKIILDHLEFDPVLGSELGIKIALHMEIEGHEKCNTTEFLKLYGIPRGFKKAIQKHLERLVIITGTGAGYSIAKAKPITKEKPISKAKSIPGFSNAEPGMRMPADNRKVCEMLVFIESKRNICTNWVELKELMVASKFDSKTRTKPVHHYYQKSVDQESRLLIDWSQIGRPQVVVDLMQEKALQFFSQSEMIHKNNTDENRQRIKDYFNEIKEMLSLLEVKNTPIELNNNSSQKQVQEEPSDHNIVAFRTKILDLLISEESPVNLKNLNLNIITYMKSIGYESSHVTEFLKLFGFPRGLKRAIEKHMEEEITIVGKAPDWMLKKNS